ncbi:ribosome small subunit-dependent GTPase A [Pseudothauera nasutitermitis]|uniref:Small ribosomal subunit biogenesis GTPase RsgA n=1 Tax=Pseudothauera nasutitermitis TaxID=2565930 RepID=A0A4S4B285_9RHOO|nr:ribosome small subunit-dependent GTPase A [Pseudothauera nasutitermitis]THF66656.1 ribosome small subunit-dependent GTPase A [Pseudothauera nasutitermitis]
MHGRITAAFGRHYEVLTAQGRLQGYPRGKKSVFACGDEVELAPGGDGQGAIEHLHERRNLLWRSDAFREKLIAANLTQVVIVVATEPAFSDLLVSRCLCAAESQELKSLIVLNKADLAERLPAAREALAMFTALGYRVAEVSALAGVEALHPLLAGERSILVGQSGMGKSTLTNALIPEANAATREISTALDSGKHTTTFARLYPFYGDGWLIDSPGMQAFGLAHLDPGHLAECFVELRPHLGSCRFRDCRHESEPGCALRAALEDGAIHARRFEHYRQIRSEIAEAKRLNPGW